MSQTIIMDNPDKDYDKLFSKSFVDYARTDAFGYLIALIFNPPESGFASYEIYD